MAMAMAMDFGKDHRSSTPPQNKYFDEILIYRGFALCGDEQLTIIKPDYYSSPSSKVDPSCRYL
ncbi:hypothetical protein O9992_12990 [Vibrio lentus]|nr:hypothetical protein [Vibrio lentus]